MKALPLSIGVLHFVGIGGIGMSGVAEVLHNLGYSVQGSDISDSANVKRLVNMGIQVSIGHAGANLGKAQVVVVSSAVKADNPEVVQARKRAIPVIHRAEALGELMRLKWSISVSGTHGKTTTTSLIATLLDKAGMDPTVINGGIINDWESNARLGGGQWLVAEADESDGTFLKLPSTIAVVTNIDAEHLDHYGSFDKLQDAFATFVKNIPFYGFAVLCVDYPEVRAMMSRVLDRRLITYGFSPQADVRAVALESGPDGLRFDVVATARKTGTKRVIKDLSLPMLGDYNVQNALAATALAGEVGINDSVLREALATFKGVKRRFTRTGKVDGVTVIDDYAHHPAEIAAVLGAARAGVGAGGIIAVVQPHRYTRLRDLFEEFCTCFNDADIVVVADVYPAGETPIRGYDRDGLVNGLRSSGRRSVISLDRSQDLALLISGIAKPGDMVLCLGAGSISQWANALPAELERLRGRAESGGGDGS